MPGQAAKRKRHDLDGADQVSLPSLLFPAPLFLPSIFSIALTCNGHANYTLKQSPKIYIKFTVADPKCLHTAQSLECHELRKRIDEQRDGMKMQK